MNFIRFIGIDVSKKTLDASIFQSGEVINKFPHIQVRTDKQGFKDLLRWTKEQGVKPKDALFGLEFTGYYSDELEQFLTKKQISYTLLPTAAKWILMVLMLAGRLEIFAILAIVSPSYWRRR